MGDTVTIHELMPRVMADVGAIGKSAKNEDAGYAARSIDDVMNAVHGALVKHAVFAMPTVLSTHYDVVEVGRNRTPMRQCTLTVRYTFYGPAGDSVIAELPSEALDSGDKATSKALSMALKYALLQALCVPTRDMLDADTQTHVRAAPPQRAPMTDEQDAKLRDWLDGDGLNGEQKATVKAWWKRERLPLRRELTEESAARVLAHLAENYAEKAAESSTENSAVPGDPVLALDGT